MIDDSPASNPLLDALAHEKLLGHSNCRCGHRLSSDGVGRYCSLCEREKGRGRRYVEKFPPRPEPQAPLDEPRTCSDCGHQTLKPEGHMLFLYVRVFDMENAVRHVFDCCPGCARITDDVDRAVAEEVEVRRQAHIEREAVKESGQ